MRRSLSAWAVGLCCWAFAPSVAPAADPISFRPQTIDPEIGKVCYAVVTTDVDGDGKPDVVALANDAVVWYQNPTWQKRDILRGTTEPDNVCLQPHDVDGDGRVDFALGSAWRPTDTKTGGSLAIVTRTGAPEGTWRAVPITSEPTLHRIRWGDLDGTGRPQLIVAPLQGRGTHGPDWGAGAGVRLLALSIPDRPFDDPWPARVIADRFHTVHNLQVVAPRPLVPEMKGKVALLLAAREGVYLVDPSRDVVLGSVKIGGSDLKVKEDAPADPGVSEAKVGRLRDGSAFVATIQPWHGDTVQVYHGTTGGGTTERVRHQVAEGLAWGHAVWCVDLDGDGDDEVVVGQRDPNPKVEPGRRGPGVMIFDPKPGSDPIAFDRTWVDEGGVAVEDLVAADLDGDGRPEIVAGGRATHNVRIYWNQGQAKP